MLKIISGIKKNAIIDQPKNITRPTMHRVRKVIFDTIYPFIKDSVILDAFAGSGAMSFEALSIGAKFAYLFDISKEATDIIKKNSFILSNIVLKIFSSVLTSMLLATVFAYGLDATYLTSA